MVATAVFAAAWLVPLRLGDEPHRALRPAEAELGGACLAAGCPDAVRAQRLAQIEDLFFERMPDAPGTLHEDLAQALLSEAEAVGIDPLLVIAMIEVESGFDAAARSSAGAHGLMQLIPSTLQSQATLLGLGPVDPADPVTNVRLGVRYLRRCLDAYPGSQQLALMAYNAGPNRVYELIQTGVLPPWALAYPRRVEQTHRRLRQLLGEDAGPRFADVRVASRSPAQSPARPLATVR
jgi:hypothetical protein